MAARCREKPRILPIRCHAASVATIILAATACVGNDATAPAETVGSGGEVVSQQTVFPDLPASSPARIAPVSSVTPDWPARTALLTGTIGRSSWLTVRHDTRITSRLRVTGLIPGHVYNVHFVIFNFPEHCTDGDPRYAPSTACGAFGPTDPGDGSIPEVQFSVINHPGVLVGADGSVVFAHKLGVDAPSEVVTGPDVVNARGALIFANVEDKGPQLPPGPERELQYRTLRGGCLGPPFFGTYPCIIVANSLLR